MAETKIEWTRNADGSAGKSWNPIRARRVIGGKVGWYCQKKSPGCQNCYAERMNLRVNEDGKGIGNGVSYTVGSRDAIEPYLDEHVLSEPLHWRKPTTIFVESMSDLFGSWVADEWIDKVYAIEALCPQHTFIHVTKRPERRLAWFNRPNDSNYSKLLANPSAWYVWRQATEIQKAVRKRVECPFTWTEFAENDSVAPWPLPNVRELVTVCNQEEADKHIPILLQTPAACRGVSVEPMLGAIDLTKLRHEHPLYLDGDHFNALDGRSYNRRGMMTGCYCNGGLDWVICGGESGPGARPMHPDWARSLRDQCQTAGVPYFLKQWGEWIARSQASREACDLIFSRCPDQHVGRREKLENDELFRVGKKLAGRLLDGREWNEVPEVH